jgi:hypothetical protein
LLFDILLFNILSFAILSFNIFLFNILSFHILSFDIKLSHPKITCFWAAQRFYFLAVVCQLSNQNFGR